MGSSDAVPDDLSSVSHFWSDSAVQSRLETTVKDAEPLRKRQIALTGLSDRNNRRLGNSVCLDRNSGRSALISRVIFHFDRNLLDQRTYGTQRRRNRTPRTLGETLAAINRNSPWSIGTDIESNVLGQCRISDIRILGVRSEFRQDFALRIHRIFLAGDEPRRSCDNGH